VKDGSKSSDPKVKRAVESAQKVRELTSKELSYLDDLKKEFMKSAGSAKIDEKVINDHSSTIAAMMMDKQTGVGAKFEASLKDYEKQIRELTGGKAKFEELAKAPKDIPLFASDEDHVRKDFITFTFENTPAIAALASVTQMQTEVLEIESIALDYLAAEAGARVLKVDKVVPMVRAVSNTVAAGSPYEADLFMAASSSALPVSFLLSCSTSSCNFSSIRDLSSCISSISCRYLSFSSNASFFVFSASSMRCRIRLLRFSMISRIGLYKTRLRMKSRTRKFII
jgi:gliding motility-associated protein GldM